ncbi:Chromosome partition protein Smc [Carpediemonas membranifera]|uniref:Chromosome partition protein Smc n=1 Tax=Carpediemonas membranifera TaxID=201153 RepID=A0A8J6AVY2_9EUKA|nr:Chromosome partition protein Smc [Carpediemonas membranifera]|eukprot:KAG9389583.1 Chromosome partition protein Smc [Carpediemonas membranifera]
MSVADLKAKIEAVEAERKQALVTIDSEARVFKADVAEKKAQLLTLTRERDQLLRRRQELDAENTAYRKRIADLETALSSTEVRMTTQIEMLKKQNLQVEKEKQSLEVRLERIEAKLKEIDAQKNELNDQLHTTDAEKLKMQQIADAETKKNLTLESELKSLQGEAKDLRTKFDTEKNQHASNVREIAVRHKNLQEQIMGIKANLAEVQRKFDISAGKNKTLLAANTALKTQKAELESVVQSQRDKVKQLERDVVTLTNISHKSPSRPTSRGRSRPGSRAAPRTPVAK